MKKRKRRALHVNSRQKTQGVYADSTKEQILEGIRQAVIDVNRAKRGEIELRDARELLAEL